MTVSSDERFGGPAPTARLLRRRPRGLDGRNPLSVALSVVLVAAMVLAAMIPWWPVYEHPQFIAAAVGSVLAGCVVGLLGAIFAWPSWVVACSVAASFLVLGVPLAVPTQTYLGVLPTAEGLVDLVTATALSWKQLVTITVPVGTYQALLVPPFLLGLVASVLATTIALRTRRPATAAIPPAVVFVAGIALGVVHDDLAVEAGLAFLLTTVAWLVRIAIGERRKAMLDRPVDAVLIDARRIASAAVLTAVAVVGATAAAFVVPPGPRDVVRAELQPPFEPDKYVSPLAGFRAAYAPDVASEQMLAVTGLPEGAGIRIATLDTYDGVVYSVGGGSSASGQFVRLPYRLDQSTAPGEPVRIDVDVLGYDDVWVPGIGQLEEIRFTPRSLGEEFHYNDVTGTGGLPDGLHEGDGFEAESMAAPVGQDLSRLSPGGAVLPEAPELPDELSRLLDDWAPASASQGERLAAVIEGFHREGYVSHGLDEDEPSRSGHALDRLAELATAKPMIGDGEQYAVAAALMARSIGFPARVVVGYLPPRDAEAGEKTHVFRSDDLQAWIEVQSVEGAWIQVDPNPEPRDIPERQPDEPTIVSRPQSALPPPDDPTPVDDLAAEPDPGRDDPDDTAGWLVALLGVLRVAGIVLAVMALLAAPFAAIIAAKARRRRLRRRAATSVERIEGGWEEFTDTAADYGYPIGPTATRAEQAATVGGLGPLVLAAVVDRAVYAPGGPGDGDDDRVWTAVEELQRRLAEPRSRRERMRAAISLGSLGGYAGSRKGAGS
ncbi:hypothetical protein BCL57_002518 [Agromyces flavus]|uniref:Transglutaminase-like domain-containing protein n=1 Tax=Agromyces flavus TaxID=589382 RepID=A0ABT1KPC3_9MICO|nr:transglutaminase-like domain-containing protein [Agromyces flavus]MCP2368345.1 hypothetical protein [Agromyces flavus]GGI47807.1 cysteine protease [Agromyces flavus]